MYEELEYGEAHEVNARKLGWYNTCAKISSGNDSASSNSSS
jgi:hypothetical protein